MVMTKSGSLNVSVEDQSVAIATKLPLLLVASDQPDSVSLLVKVFHPDHEVFRERSGEQGLTFCHAQLPDLILLDLELSDMSGRTLCRQLKSDPLTRYIPVIFITSKDDPGEEAACLEEGGVDFIVLPVHSAVLRARVMTHLMLRRATKKILEFNSTLELRVEQRTAELKATAETLHDFHGKLMDSEARATLSTIVASVSHELSTPIGNSMLTATMLADQSKSFNDLVDSGQLKRSELGVFLKVLRDGTLLMERNLNRANELLGNFKQVSVDQASDQRREFDLAEFLREIVDSMAPSLKTKPHRIVLEVPGGIVMTSLPGRIGQVVINLINNAYLHAFEERKEGLVTISAVGKDQSVAMRFTDNGAGISEENLTRFLQPFFSTKIGRGGTGLGMTIVDNLVRKSLGGSLIVHSTLGAGTTFDIELPLIAPTGIQ